MNFQYPYLSGISYDSIVDGPGIRAVFFLSGCSHRCENCHNPETHDPQFGSEITDETIEEIADQIAKRPYLTGITLSGGDPLYNPQRTANMIRALHKALNKRNKGYLARTLWIYTGLNWEALTGEFKRNTHIQEILHYTSVLVDGPYIEALADKRLAFRGSSNQRIIDVEKTLARGSVCHWHNCSSEDNAAQPNDEK